LSFDID
jgi:hypothetical protein